MPIRSESGQVKDDVAVGEIDIVCLDPGVTIRSGSDNGNASRFVGVEHKIRNGSPGIVIAGQLARNVERVDATVAAPGVIATCIYQSGNRPGVVNSTAVEVSRGDPAGSAVDTVVQGSTVDVRRGDGASAGTSEWGCGGISACRTSAGFSTFATSVSWGTGGTFETIDTIIQLASGADGDCEDRTCACTTSSSCGTGATIPPPTIIITASAACITSATGLATFSAISSDTINYNSATIYY